MLNIEVNRSADGVERYFDRELAVSDYLMKEPGIWAGRGAERLGLRGPIQRSQFVALLRNENPTTEKRLTARMNTSRQEDGGKVAAVVRQQLKAQGAIGSEDHAVTVLRRMDIGSEACQDLLHYEPGRVVGFHSRTVGGFRPGEKWAVRETNCETVTLESNGQFRQFKPSAKGKWDVLVSSTMQVSVGDQIRVTAGFREGKNVFKNNDVAQVREITDAELVLHDGRRMRRDGARIDQGICITSHASQCRTVGQVVVLPDGADAKGWYVSLSRARDSMHVYTRDKVALRQSVMHPGERKSVWELIQALRRSEPQSRNRMMPDLWAARQAEIVREIGMER